MWCANYANYVLTISCLYSSTQRKKASRFLLYQKQCYENFWWFSFTAKSLLRLRLLGYESLLQLRLLRYKSFLYRTWTMSFSCQRSSWGKHENALPYLQICLEADPPLRGFLLIVNIVDQFIKFIWYDIGTIILYVFAYFNIYKNIFYFLLYYYYGLCLMWHIISHEHRFRLISR